MFMYAEYLEASSRFREAGLGKSQSTHSSYPELPC